MHSRTPPTDFEADVALMKSALTAAPYSLDALNKEAMPAPSREAAIAALDRVIAQIRIEAPTLALGRHVRGLMRSRQPDTEQDDPVFSCRFVMFQAAKDEQTAIELAVRGGA
jgi:hypothetical protein